MNGGFHVMRENCYFNHSSIIILVGGKIRIAKLVNIFPVGGRRGLMQCLCSRKESELYHEADLSLLCKGIFWKKTFSGHVF